MNKKKLVHLCIAAIFSIIAVSGLHAANGKPFQELNDNINKNGYLIEQNSDAILTLNGELSLLNNFVVVLEKNEENLDELFTTLEDKITEGKIVIDEAFAIIEAATDANDDTKVKLHEIISKHRLAVNNSFDELPSLKQGLLDLALENKMLADLLRAQMYELTTPLLLIVSDSSSIIALMAQTAALSGTLSLLNSSHTLHNIRYSRIIEELNEQMVNLDVLEASLANFGGFLDDISLRIYSATDTYEQEDSDDLVYGFREFLSDNYWIAPRWVYIKFSTPRSSAETVFCLKDGTDILKTITSAASQLRVREGVGLGSGSVAWSEFGFISLSSIYVSNVAESDRHSWTLESNTSRTQTHMVRARDFIRNSICETYHNQHCLTSDDQRPTTLTVRIASTKLLACGF